MNKRSYLNLLDKGEVLIGSYKDKNRVLILLYYNKEGKRELDIDPIYRKNDKHSKEEIEWCYKTLGNRYHLNLRETVDIFSAAKYYEYCIYALRFNKPAKRWFKKRALEMVFKDGHKLGDFLLSSGIVDWKKLKRED